MTVQDEYTDTVRIGQEAWTNVTEAWTSGIAKVADQVHLPAVPVVPTETTPVVEQWFEFTDRLAKVNREYVLNLASAADAFGSAVRNHVEGIGEVVRDQVRTVPVTAKAQLEKVAEAERELAERVEQAQREQARAARNAERQQAREARQAARDRYEGLTKVELSEELGRRDLPKTGNVEELVDRLVEADTK